MRTIAIENQARKISNQALRIKLDTLERTLITLEVLADRICDSIRYASCEKEKNVYREQLRAVNAEEQKILAAVRQLR